MPTNQRPWSSDPLHDEGGMPEHLDPSLPEVDAESLKGMSAKQRAWWREQRRRYKDALQEERRQRRRERYGY